MSHRRRRDETHITTGSSSSSTFPILTSIPIPLRQLGRRRPSLLQPPSQNGAYARVPDTDSEPNNTQQPHEMSSSRSPPASTATQRFRGGKGKGKAKARTVAVTRYGEDGEEAEGLLGSTDNLEENTTEGEEIPMAMRPPSP